VNDFMHVSSNDDDFCSNDDEYLAVSTLCNMQYNKRPRTPYQHRHHSTFTATHKEKELCNSHAIQTHQRRLSSHKRVFFPILAFVLTLLTIFGILKCAQLLFLPVLYTIVEYTRNIFMGEEKGVQCTIWSNSPLQQLHCTLLSFTNGYLVSLINDLSRELLTKRWGALPTCIGYLFPTCGALYLNYVYIVRRILCFTWCSVFSLYKAYYLALDNPMMPFDYIEQSMLTEAVEQ